MIVGIWDGHGSCVARPIEDLCAIWDEPMMAVAWDRDMSHVEILMLEGMIDDAGYMPLRFSSVWPIEAYTGEELHVIARWDPDGKRWVPKEF